MTDTTSQAETSAEKPDDRIEKEAEKNRRELNEIPPPGTDPLHEGP